MTVLGAMLLIEQVGIRLLHAHDDGTLAEADSLTHIRHVVMGTLGPLARVSR